MTQLNRLPRGGRVDRGRTLDFTFNGRSYEGFQGDTLASALLANGVRLVGRSFKYHRPRGIVGSGVEEPNALVQLGTGAQTLPNYVATQVELYDGLEAASVNCWPSVGFDLRAVNGVISRFLPPGFYYKTFMWPRSLWPFYERVLRGAGGLGVAPTGPDADRYDKMHAHCDVLVVGAGPAGIAAALEAGRTGARVIVVDEQQEPGGSLLASRQLIGNEPAAGWLDSALSELRDMREVRLMPRSTAFGYYDHNFVTVLERVTDHLGPTGGNVPRQRIWRVRARQVVLATGAIERPLVFRNNDRPGVMLASAVSTYVNRYGVAPGRRVVVFTNNDSAYRAALDLVDAGVDMRAVVDVRPETRGKLPDMVRGRGVEVLPAHALVDVRGGRSVKAVEVRRVDGGSVVGGSRRIECDLVATSGDGTRRLTCIRSRADSPGSTTQGRASFPDRPYRRSVRPARATEPSISGIASRRAMPRVRRQPAQPDSAMACLPHPYRRLTITSKLRQAPAGSCRGRVRRGGTASASSTCRPTRPWPT